MRNYVKIFIVLALSMLTASFIGACSGGGGGGGGGTSCTSYTDFSGNWTTFEQVNATACGQGTYNENNAFTVTQAPNSSSAMLTDVNGTYQASVCNNTISGSTSYPDGGGTITADVTLTMTGANTATGTASWIYNEPGYSCSGTTQITATRISGGGDSTPPSTPTGLSAVAASSSQIDLSWTASTDNVAVTGYKLYRGGTFLKNVTGTSTSDTGLTASTQYCYTVTAVDAAANESPQSAQACATTASGGGGGPSRAWTYMVYMGADNNLSLAGLQDLNEMEMVGSTNDVAIVVQGEFSNYYTPGVPTNTLRFYVQNDGDPTSVNLNAGQSAGGNLDMGNPATLTAFIEWATTNYPAQHYALVIWDHGAGWKVRSPKATSSIFRGAVQDETSGSFMSLPDLANAVRNANLSAPLDIINFDACLMAMYEVAYEFKGLTNYMVFSEETEPGEGDPYDTILAALTATPSMSASALSSTIVTKYDEFYTVNNRGETTKSAIDMSQIDTLDTQILQLANALMNDATANNLAMAARNSTQHYAYTANHDLYDFANYIDTNLASGTAKTAAAAIKATITNMVVGNATNPDANATSNRGLAIYVPTTDETSPTDLNEYSLLACNATTRASAAGTWGAYVEYEIQQGGGGNVTYGGGGFGLYLWWETPSGGACNSDLDLYVWEPAVDWSTTGNGDWYAPFMGQTTPNGFFSMDSYDSGSSEEYYVANSEVYYGDYYFVVNYWENGTNCTQARAHLELYDPNLGFSFELTSANTNNNYGFSLVYPSPQTLDLSNFWNGQTINQLTDLNAWTDMWVPDLWWQARSASGKPSIIGDVPFGDKSSQMIFRYKKGTRLFGGNR